MAEDRAEGVPQQLRDRRKDVKPLTALGVDRLTMNNMGVAEKDIDRLYRALRMSTLGFYDLLNTTLESVGNQKVQLIIRLWVTFEALLKYCCDTHFVNIAQELEQERD